VGESGRNRREIESLDDTAYRSDFCSGCPNQEIGQKLLFKGHKIGTCSYFVADSATKKTTVVSSTAVTALPLIGIVNLEFELMGSSSCWLEGPTYARIRHRGPS
jgi:hypothetical protein